MDIYSEIISRISKLVPSLSNVSNGSLFARMAQVFASFINTVLLNQSNSELVVENAARSIRVMGKQYYVDTALAFQYGDNLVIISPDSFTYGYANIDPIKRIIKQVVVSAAARNKLVTIQACTQNSAGENTPLTTEQLQAFTDYIVSKSPFGISPEVSSPSASIIDASALYIRYNNTYSVTQIRAQVKQVLKSTQGALLGDSPVFVNDIENALEAIPGVRDAYFVNPTCDELPPVNGLFAPASGYFNFSQQLQNVGQLVVFESLR